MASIFCCPGIKPYRPQSIDQELKFTRFMAWAGFPKTSVVETQEPNDTMASQPTHVIQVVQQVNYGPLESKRYFAAVEQKEEPFVEVTERGLIEANYAKVNSCVLYFATPFSTKA